MTKEKLKRILIDVNNNPYLIDDVACKHCEHNANHKCDLEECSLSEESAVDLFLKHYEPGDFYK